MEECAHFGIILIENCLLWQVGCWEPRSSLQCTVTCWLYRRNAERVIVQLCNYTLWSNDLVISSPPTLQALYTQPRLTSSKTVGFQVACIKAAFTSPNVHFPYQPARWFCPYLLEQPGSQHVTQSHHSMVLIIKRIPRKD